MKVLIIRFSSLGDIVQALAAAQAIKDKYPDSEIHWTVRSDFASLLNVVTCVDKVWTLPRGAGVRALFKMAGELRKIDFDLIYDAHCNLRSRLLSLFLTGRKKRLVRRPKDRLKRFLLFKFRRNLFPKPFRGAVSYLDPLKFYVSVSPVPKLSLKPYSGSNPLVLNTSERICLAPSAAWGLKKWPLDRWQKIVEYLDDYDFALLGGPEDQELEEIVSVAPERVENWAGRLTWAETAYVIERAPLLIAGDTGALHLGDALGTPTVALLGPTAFGHPSRANTTVLEKDLPCRPCTKDGRGRCVNTEFKKCLTDITPEEVVQNAARLLERTS